MRQLHPSHAALLMNKPHDSGQRLNMIVRPDAQVLRTDAALGQNRGCFGKHQSSAAFSPAAQMHEMPVARVSVRAGVLAHRRNKYAVRKRNIPNRERIKQVNHTVYTAFLNSEEAPDLWPIVMAFREVGVVSAILRISARDRRYDDSPQLFESHLARILVSF